MQSKQQAALRRHVIAALVGSILALGATVSYAGECPADKRVPDGQGQKNANHAAKGVTDAVVHATDLAKTNVGVNRLFRARKLEVQPGGIVPWHSHGDRPALIYIVSGEITEYASTCAVPIVHKGGEVAPENNQTSHWWQNHGKTPTVLYSFDIFRPADDAKVM